MGKTFWGVGSAAAEQLRCKAIMVAKGLGKFGPESDPSIPFLGYPEAINLLGQPCRGWTARKAVGKCWGNWSV